MIIIIIFGGFKMSEDKNRKTIRQDGSSEISEYIEHSGYPVHESVQSGGTKPIDISLMTGKPTSSNSNKNGDD